MHLQGLKKPRNGIYLSADFNRFGARIACYLCETFSNPAWPLRPRGQKGCPCPSGWGNHPSSLTGRNCVTHQPARGWQESGIPTRRNHIWPLLLPRTCSGKQGGTSLSNGEKETLTADGIWIENREISSAAQEGRDNQKLLHSSGRRGVQTGNTRARGRPENLSAEAKAVWETTRC